MIESWKLRLCVLVMLALSLSLSCAGWARKWPESKVQNGISKRRLLFQEEKVDTKVGWSRNGWSGSVSSGARELEQFEEEDPDYPDYPDQDDASRRKCAADLLALFGGKEAASSVELSRAKELRACVRDLVPGPPFLSPKPKPRGFVGNEHLNMKLAENPSNEFFQLIKSPPKSVEQLARKAVEWGGDINVILTEMENTTYPVPDIEGAAEDKCSLTRFDSGKRFKDTEINLYMTALFLAIEKLAPSAGLNISLSRYDLFHGHMFTAHDTGRLGILFHAREFPAYDEKVFPLNLGFCQKDSNVPFDYTMTLRNIVWLAPMPDCSKIGCKISKWLAPASLFVLDTTMGNILSDELVPWYLDIVHTVQEGDLGDLVIDVNYFNSLDGSLEQKLFLC